MGWNERREWPENYEMVTVVDPNENSFSLQMPKGWKNQAFLVRNQGAERRVVHAVSPDGNTTIFMGDPNMPNFQVPNPYMDYSDPLFHMNPMLRIHQYVPAEPFFVDYTQRRYGGAPGFRITGATPNPTLEQAYRAEGQRLGVNWMATATAISFEFTENGRHVRGLLNGATLLSDSGWIVDLGGILSYGDPNRYTSLFYQMGQSMQTSAQWRQQQNWAHQQAMGQIQSNHQAMMASMQSGHQQRMNDIQSSGEANTRRWQEQQAQNDISHQQFIDQIRSTPPRASQSDQEDFSHRRFLNYIQEQNTVVDSSGNTYQVDGSHERYYVNRRDNTYIGTDSTTDREGLRARGVNPDDYEEVKIKR
jgi:hypothetical protein